MIAMPLLYGRVVIRAVKARVLLLLKQVENGRRETPGGLWGVKNEPWISRWLLCPISSADVRNPSYAEWRTRKRHVAPVMSRQIFGVPKQRLDTEGMTTGRPAIL